MLASKKRAGKAAELATALYLISDTFYLFSVNAYGRCKHHRNEETSYN